MADQEFTEDDLKSLNKAIASGVTRVEYNDRTVVYRSLDEMLQTRELIKRKLGLVKRGSRVLAKTSKGVC